ncbi:MAG TPA: hypothetical protein VK436_08050 [Methanocella sp.]|nr:hypothetical protein [Methanocella sp.]
MDNVNIKLIEFGVSFFILAIFIALTALAEDIFGQWSNIAYIAIILAFVVVISLFGLKISNYLY